MKDLPKDLRSYSQFAQFGQCPRKRQLSQRYEPKVTAAALAEGDVFHLCLAKMYRQGKTEAGREVFEITRDGYLTDAKDAGLPVDKIEKLEIKFSNLAVILEAYGTYILPRDLDHYEILEVEMEFKVDLDDKTELRGFVDGIFRDRKTGVRYIVEHKYKSGHDDDLVPLDLQVSLYTLALLPVYGHLPTLYNVGLKPANRRGKNETMADFSARVADLVRKEAAAFRWTSGEFDSKNFLRRTYSRGNGELSAALQQVRSQARFMKEIDENPELVWRNVGDHCLYMCPFKPICIEEDPLLIGQLYDRKYKGPEAPKAVRPV